MFHPSLLILIFLFYLCIIHVSSFTLYFQKPNPGTGNNWAFGANPNIYYWAAFPGMPAVSWPGISMIPDGGRWYKLDFPNQDTVNVIFNDPASSSTKTSDQTYRTSDGWYDWNTATWSNTDPRGTNYYDDRSASYRGCYADSTVTRDLYTLAGTNFTVETCTRTARIAGFAYFGLTAGGICRLSHTYGAYGTSTACTKSCFNNPNQICGSINDGVANSVYYVQSTSCIAPNVQSAHVELSDGSYLETTSTQYDLINTSPFTITCFGRRDIRNEYSVMISRGITSTAYQMLQFGWRQDNTIYFGFYGDDLNGPIQAASDLGIWHHYAITYDPSTKNRLIYRDGQVIASGLANQNPQTAGVLYIGKMGNYYFKGGIDEVRLYSRVLSINEMTSLMQIPAISLPTSLYLYVSFNTDTGVIALDASDRKDIINARLSTTKTLFSQYQSPCVADNVCLTGNGGCDSKTTCTPQLNGRLCGPCPAGYTGNGGDAGGCKLNNVCATNNGGCDIRMNCTNILGGRTCSDCAAGFIKTSDTTCQQIDYCAKHLPPPDGCDPLVTCANVVGGFSCGPCPAGYTGDGYKGCKSIDFCATNNGGCDLRTNCTNIPGGRKCSACPYGFIGSGDTGCTKINLCEQCVMVDGKPSCGGCHPLTTCIDIATGGNACTDCPYPYWSGNGKTGCNAVDYCKSRAETNGDCDPRTNCTSLIGSRICSACPQGFTGTGETGCIDIDECDPSTARSFCPFSRCINLIGSYICAPYLRTAISPAPAGGAQFDGANSIRVSTTDGGEILSLTIDAGIYSSAPYAPGNWSVVDLQSLSIYYGAIHTQIIRKYPLLCSITNTSVFNQLYSSNSINVQCKLVSGIGIGLLFTLYSCIANICGFSDAGLSIPPTQTTLSYPIPKITPNTLKSTTQGPGNAISVSSFGDTISFQGEFFTSNPTLMSVRFGPTTDPLRYGCSLQPSTTSTMIVCTTQQGAVDSDHSFSITYLDNISFNPPVRGTDVINCPTAPPEIHAVSGCDVHPTDPSQTINCPTQGNRIMTLIGIHFQPPIVVLINNQQTQVISSNSTHVTFILLSGVGFTQSVIVSSGADGKFSVPKLWLSYAVPHVTGISGCEGSATDGSIGVVDCNRNGGNTITITGTNFGSSGASVLIANEPCANVTHSETSPHTSLTCILPPGRQLIRLIVLQLNGQPSTSNVFISYKLCPAGTYPNPSTSNSTCVPCQPGSYAPEAGATFCAPCPMGTASNASSAASCQSCDAGTFSNQTGLTACLECAIGTYASGQGQKQCSPCPLGTYSNSTGKLECDPCAAGYISDKLGATACRACTPGTYTTTTGQVTCVECKQGRYSARNGTAVCDICPDGTEQPRTGQTSCNNCTIGRYMDRTSDPPACQACGVGFYQNENGTTACKACGPGTVSSTTGASSCVACLPGFYAEMNGERLQCQPCAAGTFSNITGATSCIPCTPGTYQSATNATSCYPCLPGLYALNQASRVCTPCEGGKYSSYNGSSTCLACDAGSFAVPQATSCFQCDAGRWQSAEQQTSCRDCGAGTYTEKVGESTCKNCDVGYYQDKTAQSACKECGVGSYTSAAGQSSCVLCAAGFYNNRTGQYACLACPSGWYSDTNGTQICRPCSAGTFSSGDGQTTCTECSPGFYSSTSGASTCSQCSSGTYQTLFGQQKCDICTAGTYAAGRGSTSCTRCALGTIAPSHSAGMCYPCGNNFQADETRTKCVCSAGYYFMFENDNITGITTQECRPCPPGADCDAGGAMFSTLLTRPGWWRAPGPDLLYHECNLASHCLGGSLNTSGCAENREGVVCALCSPGYQAAALSASCTPCPSRDRNIVATVFLSLVVLFALFILYVVILRADRRREAVTSRSRLPFDEIWAQVTWRDKKKYPPNLTAAERVDQNVTYSLKIVLGFFQIMTNILSFVILPWPSAFRSVILAFSFLNIDIIPWANLSCLTSYSYYVKVLVVTLTPMFLFAGLLFFFVFPSYIRDRWDMSDSEHYRQARRQSRFRFFKLCIFTLFLMYPSISSHVLSLFACRWIDGIPYLMADFNVHCFDSTWYNNLWWAIIMVIVYPIGVPAFFFYLLFHFRHRLTTPSIRSSLGVLYEGYHHANWWFELADMTHKLFLTSLLRFFPRHMQLPAAMIAVVIYLISLLVISPYVRSPDDTLHLITQILLFLLLLSGWIVQMTSSSGLDRISDTLLSALLLTLIVCLVGTFLIRVITMLRTYYRQHQRKHQHEMSSGEGTPWSGASGVQMKTVSHVGFTNENSDEPLETDDRGSDHIPIAQPIELAKHLSKDSITQSIKHSPSDTSNVIDVAVLRDQHPFELHCYDEAKYVQPTPSSYDVYPTAHTPGAPLRHLDERDRFSTPISPSSQPGDDSSIPLASSAPSDGFSPSSAPPSGPIPSSPDPAPSILGVRLRSSRSAKNLQAMVTHVEEEQGWTNNPLHSSKKDVRRDPSVG